MFKVQGRDGSKNFHISEILETSILGEHTQPLKRTLSRKRIRSSRSNRLKKESVELRNFGILGMKAKRDHSLRKHSRPGGTRVALDRRRELRAHFWAGWLPPFCSPLAFPWADDFVGDPTAVEITGLRAHALALDEALDATGIEGKVV